MAKHVLVVDDHAAVATAMKVAFRTDGRFAVTATSATAAEALERLDGIDVVLLDLYLPDLGGPELIRALRDRRPQLPIVLHSAADATPAVEAVRPLVDAVALKSDLDGVLAALARVTGT